MQEQKEHIELSALLPLIREVISRGGEFELHPRGESMLPTICQGRDTVMLSSLDRPPVRGDLLLYQRDTGAFVLHRVVRVAKDGTLSMRGDNQYFIERGIQRNQVIAVVRRYYRRGREMRTDSLRVRLYCTRRTLTYPFRRVFRAVARRVKRLFGGKIHG